MLAARVALVKPAGKGCAVQYFSKFVLATFALALACSGVATAQDFTLEVDGQRIDLQLGVEKRITLRGGQDVRLKLGRSAVSRFAGKGFAFRHPGELSVAQRDLGDGIVQYFLSSATGTLVIVQTYADVDPATMVDTMLDTMTDEDIAAGAKFESKPHEQKLASGKLVKGKRGRLLAKDDDVTLDVMAWPKGAGGILMITMHDRITSPDEAAIIEQFWTSLQLE
jgi:hypothetical protein